MGRDDGRVGIEKTIVMVGGTGSGSTMRWRCSAVIPSVSRCGPGSISAAPTSPVSPHASSPRSNGLSPASVASANSATRDAGCAGAAGMHVDDPRMDPIFEKLADLGLPVNIHVGEDQWMYEEMTAPTTG